MKAQEKEKTWVTILVLAILITLTLWLGGCSVGVNARYSAFYPKNLGNIGPVGDPATSRYADHGYAPMGGGK